MLAQGALDAVLLLALVYALVRLGGALLADTPSGAAGETVSVAAQASGSAAPPDVAAITSAHLFGRAAPDAAPAPAPAAPPVELALRGVLLSDVPNATRALIAPAGGADVAYAPGAPLPGGARLLEVRPSEVVIWRNARTETLRLNPAATVVGAARLEQVDNRANDEMARRLGQLQRELQRDPASTVGLLRFEPIHERGRLIGFRVNPGSASGLLESLGLRAGDVVSAVNGIALESIPNGFDALAQLTSAGEVRLDVARGDARIVYAYRVAR